MAAFLDKFKFTRKPPTGESAKKAAAASVKAGAAKTAAKIVAPESDRDTGLAASVLLHPHVTEKAARMSGARQYVFVVQPRATKLQVKEAVFRLYGVRPTEVNIVRVGGKQVRFGRTIGQQKDWKKAVVTLAPGASLAIYEGV